MENKTVLITGATSGLGLALAVELAKIGYNVCMNYGSSDERAKKAYDSVLSHTSKSKLLLIKADVSNPDAVKAMFSKINSTFGMINSLINVAGLNIDGPFASMDYLSWKRVQDINLTGPFLTSQSFVQQFTGENGHIINFSSSTAITGRKNGANYCSSKAGVISLTKCLAKELAPKIAVNCIMPSFVTTDEVMKRYNLHDKDTYEKLVSTIPQGRLGTNDDVTKTVLFILEQSSYITGQSFFINGGEYM